MLKFSLLTFLAFFLSFSNVMAQEAVTVAGGDASGNGGTVSYSVGQLVYTTHASANGSVSSGVQQSYIISTLTAIQEMQHINLTAYPNPTTDYLILSGDDLDGSQLSYRLFDMTGRQLVNQKLQGNEKKIEMGGLLPAVYFLKIIDGKKEIKAFKIIKK